MIGLCDFTILSRYFCDHENFLKIIVDFTFSVTALMYRVTQKIRLSPKPFYM